MQKLVITILIAVFVFAFAGAAFAKDAPDFELKDLKGKKVALEDLLDDCNLLIIDFWQVGCKPCNELLEHLQEYADDYEEDGVQIVIISLDKSLTQAQVEPFFKSHEYTFRVLLDPDQETGKDYQALVPPVTFMINPDGEIIWEHRGYKAGQEKEVKENIEKFLAGEKVENPEEEK